jgi:hypothetical protein
MGRKPQARAGNGAGLFVMRTREVLQRGDQESVLLVGTHTAAVDEEHRLLNV